MATYTYTTTPIEDATLAARVAEINANATAAALDGDVPAVLTEQDVFRAYVEGTLLSHTQLVRAQQVALLTDALLAASPADQAAIAKQLGVGQPDEVAVDAEPATPAKKG